MRLVRLRWRAGGIGLMIYQKENCWIVTNMATTKYLKEVVCKDLDEVETVLYGWSAEE